MTAVANAWLTASLVSAAATGRRGRILRLDVPDWAGSVPGQHVDVRLTAPDGYQAVRSYSLASSGPSTTVEIAVAELSDGEVSPYLVEDMAVGDQVEIRGPIGGYFVWTTDRPGPVQLIAGGSGVVPMVSIVRAHAVSGSTAPMQLLYSVRTISDALYADELEAFAGDRFQLDWIYSRTAPAGSHRPAGRVNAADIAAKTIPPTDEPLIMVCGPTAFVESVADLLVAAGHDAGRIRTERFGGA